MKNSLRESSGGGRLLRFFIGLNGTSRQCADVSVVVGVLLCRVRNVLRCPCINNELSRTIDNTMHQVIVLPRRWRQEKIPRCVSLVVCTTRCVSLDRPFLLLQMPFVCVALLDLY